MSKPRPIRRADGTELKGTADTDDALMERVVDRLTDTGNTIKVREKKKGKVVVQTDERQTVRSFARTGELDDGMHEEAPTWEGMKEKLIEELKGRADKRVWSEELGDIDMSKHPGGQGPSDPPGAVRRV